MHRTIVQWIQAYTIRLRTPSHPAGTGVQLSWGRLFVNGVSAWYLSTSILSLVHSRWVKCCLFHHQSCHCEEGQVRNFEPLELTHPTDLWWDSMLYWPSSQKVLTSDFHLNGLHFSDSLPCHLDDQTIAFESETLGLGLSNSLLSVLRRAELNKTCTLWLALVI